MSDLVDTLLNWWAVNPGGMRYTGQLDLIYIDAPQWRDVTVTIVTWTVFISAVLVGVSYTFTRRVGGAFVRRWWLFLFLASTATAIFVLVYLSRTHFVWNGVAFAIPEANIYSRAAVGFLQGLLSYYVLSVFATTVFGRLLRLGNLMHNHRIPLPKLF